MEIKITAQTNYKKNNRQSLAAVFTADRGGTPIPEKTPEEVERANRIKDVCLKCRKKVCKGSERCFEKERNKKND